MQTGTYSTRISKQTQSNQELGLSKPQSTDRVGVGLSAAYATPSDGLRLASKPSILFKELL